ncbi:unnamed protein product [Schistocephalus solidus]|uniref:Bestrophin-3 n=1 Tax=Schistocephalus solidus TaxID=70667 RepID=A0A183SI14_SCHSO|nr:unnamed protein product [Schistocephalus solidus]
MALSFALVGERLELAWAAYGVAVVPTVGLFESDILGMEAHTTPETLTWLSPPVVTVAWVLPLGRSQQRGVTGSVSPGATGGARKTRSQNRLSHQESLAVPSTSERSRGSVAAKTSETGGKRHGNGTCLPDRSRPPTEGSRQASRPSTSPRLPEDLRCQEGVPSLWHQQHHQPYLPTDLLFRDFLSPMLPVEATISMDRNTDLCPRSIPQANRSLTLKKDATLKEVEVGVKGSPHFASFFPLRGSRPSRLKFSASSLADMSDSEEETEEEKIPLSPERHGTGLEPYKVAAPSQLHLPQNGANAEDFGPLKDSRVRDPVLPSQLQYSAEAAEMIVI